MPSSFRALQPPPAPPAPPARKFGSSGVEFDDITIQVSTVTSPVISCTEIAATSYRNYSSLGSRNSSSLTQTENFSIPPAVAAAEQKTRTRRTQKQLFKIILKQIQKAADTQLRTRSWLRLRLFVSQRKNSQKVEINKTSDVKQSNQIINKSCQQQLSDPFYGYEPQRECSSSGGSIQLGRVGLMSLRESSQSLERRSSPSNVLSPVTFSRLSSMSPLSEDGILIDAFMSCISPSPPDIKLMIGCHFVTDKSISNRGRWTRHFLTISDISATNSCSFLQLHSKQLTANTIHSFLSQSLMRFCGVLTKSEMEDWHQNWWQREMEAEEQASPPRYLKL